LAIAIFTEIVFQKLSYCLDARPDELVAFLFKQTFPVGLKNNAERVVKFCSQS